MNRLIGFMGESKTAYSSLFNSAAGEDAGAPRTPSRVLPSRLLGIDGDGISFVETLKVQGQELRCEYKGKISGNEIRGSRTVGSYRTEEFVASRAK